MKVIWRRGEVTVRDVYEEMLAQRKIAYTTVMTMMGILEEKGHLSKSQGERAFVYRPTESKSRVVGSMVKEFVNRVFDGSAKPLLMHLVESENLSADELDEIAKLTRRRGGKEKR